MLDIVNARLSESDAITTRRAAPDQVSWSAHRLQTALTPIGELASLTAEWRALAASAIEPNVFYEPAFALAAAPVFGRSVFALVVKSPDQELLGLFPLALTRHRYGVPYQLLVGWTHPFAPLGTPLVAREHAHAVLEACFDRIASDPALPKLMLLPMLAEDGPFAAAIEKVLARRSTASARFGLHQRALLEPNGERARYIEDHVSGRRRKELRRQRHRLEAMGSLEFTRDEMPASAVAALRDFFALEARGWKGRGGTAALSQPEIAAFVEQAVCSLAATNQARVDRLTVDGHAIAATITLSSGDTTWFWKTAYDETFRRYSPGVQLALHLTEDLLGEQAMARADSCAVANHPMIDHLWRERRTLSTRLIGLQSGADARFALACQLERLRRAAIDLVRCGRDAFKPKAKRNVTLARAESAG